MIPARLLPHTASVEAYDGASSSFAAPVDLPCYFEQRVPVRMRDSNGAESAAEAALYANPGAPIPDGSRLTVNGFGATVLAVANLDDGGVTGLAHREFALRLWPLT